MLTLTVSSFGYPYVALWEEDLLVQVGPHLHLARRVLCRVERAGRPEAVRGQSEDLAPRPDDAGSPHLLIFA